MKRHAFLICILLTCLFEIAVVFLLLRSQGELPQDTIAVNEVVKTVERDWQDLRMHANATRLDYVVLDENGTVLFKTRDGLSESIHAAILHRDTILDIAPEGTVCGKVLLYNTSSVLFAAERRTAIFVLTAVLAIQTAVLVCYFLYLHRTLSVPFRKLKGFAERVAAGNFDVPLEMDRRNLFGAFTESFDLMRSELKKARQAEAEANAGKKELVAKLSHDIKTPVASIKAASEVGYALSETEKMKNNYTQIIRKADQINALITNLFTATLEELQQLSVTPVDLESSAIALMLDHADYLNRAILPELPDCLICADPLRLQQVFDNIFANSYKYAGTDIVVSVSKDHRNLILTVEDLGGGVPPEELPFIKDKFRRGGNAAGTEGAGLGLYLADYFMKEMHGALLVENGIQGLKVTVLLPLSGEN